MRPLSALCSLLALALALLPRAVGQPYAMLSWLRTGYTANTAPVTYTQDGGRSFANATASGYFQYGISSPMGGACITFFRSTAGVYGMQQWNPSTYAWTTFVPGFPTTLTRLSVISIRRSAESILH
jgi:hypothetical protein